MKRASTSKVTSKSQTVIPAAIREKLGIGPGDCLRYIETAEDIIVAKAPTNEGDPFDLSRMGNRGG